MLTNIPKTKKYTDTPWWSHFKKKQKKNNSKYKALTFLTSGKPKQHSPDWQKQNVRKKWKKEKGHRVHSKRYRQKKTSSLTGSAGESRHDESGGKVRDSAHRYQKWCHFLRESRLCVFDRKEQERDPIGHIEQQIGRTHPRVPRRSQKFGVKYGPVNLPHYGHCIWNDFD